MKLGQVVATRGALGACSREYLAQCLARHTRGDWGVVGAEDAAANDQALREGARILSAYPIDPAKPCEGHGANTLWIITEADRSATTLWDRAFRTRRHLRRHAVITDKLDAAHELLRELKARRSAPRSA
jgi:hypothetical protein